MKKRPFFRYSFEEVVFASMLLAALFVAWLWWSERAVLSGYTIFGSFVVMLAACALTPPVGELVERAMSAVLDPIGRLKRRLLGSHWAVNTALVCAAVYGVSLIDADAVNRRVDAAIGPNGPFERAFQLAVYMVAVGVPAWMALELTRKIREYGFGITPPREYSHKTTRHNYAVGVIVELERNGFPLLTWSQEVGTGRSMGQGVARAMWIAQLVTVALGGVVGLYFWGWQGALGGLFVGGWLAALMPREAATPDLRLPIEGSSAGAPRVPRPLTDDERRFLAQAETRFEDCEVFIEDAGDELFFCVARGDKSKGPLPVVERVPWSNLATSFDNFEVGSHRQWFRTKSAPDNLPDWDVIIAQARQPRLVKVAESVNDHASMVELLARLQITFTGQNRDEIVSTWKRTRDEARRKTAGHSAGSDGVPTKPF